MIKITSIAPEMCQCGRLYKDRRDKDGNMICSACLTGLSVEELEKLWKTPIRNPIFASTIGRKVTE